MGPVVLACSALGFLALVVWVSLGALTKLGATQAFASASAFIALWLALGFIAGWVAVFHDQSKKLPLSAMIVSGIGLIALFVLIGG
jgi:hypothetical protein